MTERVETVGRCYVVVHLPDELQQARNNLIRAIKDIRRGFYSPVCSAHVTAYYLRNLTTEEAEYACTAVEAGLDLLEGCQISLEGGFTSGGRADSKNVFLEWIASTHLDDFRLHLD